MIASPPPVIADRYELGVQLGSGGTAVVYQAFDHTLRVERAVKLLSVPPRYRTSLRRRLEREAQAMAALDNPHLLRVYDVGADGEHDYVVMDLAEGGSLADVVDEHGPMPPRTALAYTIQLLAALDAAHEARVVHRDIKPQNILLSRSGVARLADFGIALLDREDIERHTRVGALMGSLAYMAPEQRQDASSVGPVADLYAAGCTLYNLLTGASPLDLFLAAPSSPRWMGVPPAIQSILMRATRPEPEERYTSAREMAFDVAGALPTITDGPTGPVHPPEASTEAALRALIGDTPPPAAPGLPSQPGLLAGAHPPTVVPEDEGPTLTPPTRVPQTAAGATTLGDSAPAPRGVLALLLLLGLSALGLGLAQLRSADTALAAHRPLPLLRTPAVPVPPSPRTMINEALAAMQTQRFQAPPARAPAARPAVPASCARYPVSAGSSPASGTWQGTRMLPQGTATITLVLGGTPGSISGCSLVAFFGETTAHPVRGGLRDGSLTLQEGDGYSYTLSVTENNLKGTFTSGQGTIPAAFRRLR